MVGPGRDVWVPLSHPPRQPLQLLRLGPATERRSPHVGLAGSGPAARHVDPSTVASVRPVLITASPLVDGEELGARRKASPDTPASPNLSHSEASLLRPPEPGTPPPRQPYLQLLLRLLGDHQEVENDVMVSGETPAQHRRVGGLRRKWQK